MQQLLTPYAKKVPGPNENVCHIWTTKMKKNSIPLTLPHLSCKLLKLFTLPAWIFDLINPLKAITAE